MPGLGGAPGIGGGVLVGAGGSPASGGTGGTQAGSGGVAGAGGSVAFGGTAGSPSGGSAAGGAPALGGAAGSAGTVPGTGGDGGSPGVGGTSANAGAAGSGDPGTGGAVNSGGTAGTPGVGGGSGVGGTDTVGSCRLPTSHSWADVQAAYDDWKATVVTSDGARGFLRVRKPDSGSIIDSTVSEGIGYGMILAVYMDDQTVFDNLWRYEQLFLDDNGLMHWEIHPDGNSVIGTGAATDGDEDMAWALVMADRQWGGSGTLDDTYLNYAIDLINRIYQYEFDHSGGARDNMLLPGDSWGTPDITNISYFAPAYYRVFGEVTGNVSAWNAIIDTNYVVLNNSLNAANGNENNGLVPPWSTYAGTPVEAYSGAPLHFQNDSTRTPFRIGQDYCYFFDVRAKAYLETITSFYVGVGVANIVDGYDLDGTPHPDFSLSGGQPASFIGPAGVAAMNDAANQTFIDEAYAALATLSLDAGTIYYQKSWTALSLLMMTGNFIELQ